jgi:hypothetical protein
MVSSVIAERENGRERGCDHRVSGGEAEEGPARPANLRRTPRRVNESSSWLLARRGYLSAMTQHRWKLRRAGAKLIVDADDASDFTGDDVDALVEAIEPLMADDDVQIVELTGDATMVEGELEALTIIVRRLGAMVNRHRKGFTVRL